jgi:hypothetical protein
MSKTVPKMTLPEVSPEEREARRQRRAAAIDRIEKLRAEILARRGGEPVEVDDILDDMRGRGHEPERV